MGRRYALHPHPIPTWATRYMTYEGEEREIVFFTSLCEIEGHLPSLARRFRGVSAESNAIETRLPLPDSSLCLKV